jgi:hypothetical protein
MISITKNLAIELAISEANADLQQNSLIAGLTITDKCDIVRQFFI